MKLYVSRDDIRSATGSDYCYHYKELTVQADVKMVRNYCTRRRILFAPIAKAFNANVNGHWVLRHYLAIKFATAANLLAGSAAYAHENNLLLGVPYFNYYTVLSACRSFLLISPQVVWDGEKTMRMTHQNIINRTADYMRDLDPSRRTVWQEQLETLRDYRELYSYHFPLSGPNLAGGSAFDVEAAQSLARLIAELASLNSECLDAALDKHSSANLPVERLTDHDWASVYRLAGIETPDQDDDRRFDKYVKGWTTISPLEVMTTDGLMDDVYANWSASDDIVGQFDPDTTSRLVLAL